MAVCTPDFDPHAVTRCVAAGLRLLWLNCSSNVATVTQLLGKVCMQFRSATEYIGLSFSLSFSSFFFWYLGFGDCILYSKFKWTLIDQILHLPARVRKVPTGQVGSVRW